MTTVRDASYDVLRKHGLTTIFGNPGSNELHFLSGMPGDFNYILGLHEGVVVGMADGFAQASGHTAFVNLHSAAGTGNAMGALANARASHTPLVVTAGQQVRETIGIEPLLTNTDATALPRPLVKHSAEPLSATDVPRALSEAVHQAQTHPHGPVYLSIPYDDWERELADSTGVDAGKRVAQAASPSSEQSQQLAAQLSAARNPVCVLGEDVDASGAFEASVALVERLGMPAWIAPSPSRCPFPTRHPSFRGALPASAQEISNLLTGHDLIVVAGAPAFRYHQYDPGNYLPEGAELVHITSDPNEAARAPIGNALVGNVRSILEAVLESLHRTDQPTVRPNETRTVPSSDEQHEPIPPAAVFETVDQRTPNNVIYVKESTSTTNVFWDHVDISHPGSYFFPAAGGLGFGMPAAVGVQLARPDRPVVALIGDGSANYGITALWSAAM